MYRKKAKEKSNIKSVMPSKKRQIVADDAQNFRDEEYKIDVLNETFG